MVNHNATARIQELANTTILLEVCERLAPKQHKIPKEILQNLVKNTIWIFKVNFIH